jgi:hypothetical protein
MSQFMKAAAKILGDRISTASHVFDGSAKHGLEQAGHWQAETHREYGSAQH